MPALIFAIVAAYCPAALSAAVAPRWWVILIGAPLLLLAMPKGPWTATHRWGLLFLLAATISTFYSVSRMDSLTGLLELAALATLFCAASQSKTLKHVWLTAGLGCVVNLCAAIVQRVAPDIIPSIGAAGLFYHQDVFGGFAALVLVGVIWSPVSKWTALIALSAIACLAMAQARGAVLAAVIGALAPLLWNRKANWPVFTGLALLAMAWLVPAFTERLASVSARIVEWKQVASNLHIFGWGYNTLGSVFPFEYADNEFVNLAFGLGVLSLLFWWFITHALWKGARHAPDAFAVAVAAITDALSSNPFHNPASAALAAVALGRLAGAGHLVRRERPTRTNERHAYPDAWRGPTSRL